MQQQLTSAYNHVSTGKEALAATKVGICVLRPTALLLETVGCRQWVHTSGWQMQAWPLMLQLELAAAHVEVAAARQQAAAAHAGGADVARARVQAEARLARAS